MCFCIFGHRILLLMVTIDSADPFTPTLISLWIQWQYKWPWQLIPLLDFSPSFEK